MFASSVQFGAVGDCDHQIPRIADGHHQQQDYDRQQTAEGAAGVASGEQDAVDRDTGVAGPAQPEPRDQYPEPDRLRATSTEALRSRLRVAFQSSV